jgi:shikimate kinase
MRTKSGVPPATNEAARKAAPQARTVFLVGFMGAGKTSVGRALSQRLDCPFEDLDDRIQNREGKTIEEIFRESGEPAFREAETAALRALLRESRSPVRVVALGGGTFVHASNTSLIKQAGVHSVFLDAPVEELYRRCEMEQKSRPLRQTAEQFRELYRARQSYYGRAAFRIETNGKDVNAVAAEVACKLGLG